MKFWNEYPLYRILIPMILGIVLGNWIHDMAIPMGILFFVFVISSVWIFRPNFLRKFKLRYVGGFLISLLFLIFGYQLIWFNTGKHLKNHYTKIDSITHFVVLIKSPIIEKKNTYKTVGKVIAAYQNQDTIPQLVAGDILLYFEKKSKPNLHYGDEILIANELSEVQSLGNPNEFDYPDYLRKQNIYHQVYLRPIDWIKTSHQSPNLIIKFSLKIRNILLSILRSYHFDQAEFAVASAILVGYDEYLDSDLRQLYAGSGAMHILCVSGLHVGIIVLMFNVLFAFLKKIKWGKYIYTLLLISSIWLYALVTGLSPSVFRAAVMFSFISFGTILNRKTSTYNSLGASAVVLLIYDPFMLFFIGFQLSYLAVLAILYLQPYFSKIFYSKYWIANKIRDLIAVSLAAQIGTFPLAIYYFHQFPNLFFITNLIVIPLSFFILIVGFASIFIFLFRLGTTLLGMISTKILYISLWSLNYTAKLIATLPFAVSRDLYFTSLDTFLIYLIIIFMSWGLISRKIKGVFFAALLFIILFASNVWLRYSAATTGNMVIYHIPKHSMIEVSVGPKSIILMDSSLLMDSSIYQRYNKDYELYNRVKDVRKESLDSLYSIHTPFFSFYKNMMDYQHHLFLLVDKRNLLPMNSKPLKFDYVILRNNPSLSLRSLDSLITFDTLIIDGSNTYWKIRKWKEDADDMHIPYWITKERGAVIISMPPS